MAAILPRFKICDGKMNLLQAGQSARVAPLRLASAHRSRSCGPAATPAAADHQLMKKFGYQ